MRNKNIISPIGLKGNQINERMKELMGISSINENKTNIVVELTKMGPDGKAYAIIRENHEYYIKSTTKTSKLVAEDFKYIGGLQNKKEEAYPSYAKAIKHLNLRFNSLSEAYNSDEKINTFLDDNLLSENGFSGGFVDMPKGGGFSGNVYEEETVEEAEINGLTEDYYDEPYSDDVEGTPSRDWDKDDAEDIEDDEAYDDEDLSETEQAVEDMLGDSWMDEELEMGSQDSQPQPQRAISNEELFDMMDNMSAADFMQFLKDAGSDIKGKVMQMISSGADKARNYLDNRYSESELYEGKLSINKAINQMDALIDGLSESKKKVKTQK
jgi:hypothetical protein